MARMGKTAESFFFCERKMVKIGYCKTGGLGLFLIKNMLKVRFDAKKMQII